ncbi:hypothetical protein DFH08DRAFT_719066 [Mycena albidolilacea]|uniref:Ubiquitin-like protease family profile domain-containing protein n=1 Tax=Mycena albidolilacea TaxID=1033008 RepID=A0AAD7EBF5_9AGAR|nr:hypothetical protein DFH08DRAFT_719066 [Mycena albidolilacea]
MLDWAEEDISSPPPPPPPPPLPPPPPPIAAGTRGYRMEKSVNQAALAWDLLLPQLVDPYAQYQQASHGQRPSIIPAAIHHECSGSCNTGSLIKATIQCLYISLSVLLVKNGVFPTSPTKPRTGVSLDLLEIYRALFERSCDAITALAAALHTIYERRGFRVYSSKSPGMRAKNPFREGLGNAVIWSSHLRDRLQGRLHATLAAADQALFPTSQEPASEDPAAEPQLTPGRASRVLRERCPACFGLEEWGRDLHHGGDVILGADGCFSYRHLRSAGDGPISYDPSYFISPEKVHKARDKVAEARKKAPVKPHSHTPTDTVDGCEETWNAANEKKQKADPKRYDASGIFAMTCRHSQVLFLANIDTPGEQQHYLVALMEELREHLPQQATIVQAYDVGCVLDRSLNLYPILSPDFRERVSFIINAMHAYGHHWTCQIYYSPRFRLGVGLADLEGIERFWSRIRKLIGITRNQWNSRRIWMIDQYTAFVNDEGRDNLGDWITRQQNKNLGPKQTAARKVLRECGVPVAELRQEWEAQKVAQSKLRSHAPARLHRELDKVLKLQGQIDGIENLISEAKVSMTKAGASKNSLNLLKGLQLTHETLSTQAEALYSSLNIQEVYPELKGLPLQFTHLLVAMRDLKINLRHRAIGSFYEWESIDQAVKGKREPQGTKLNNNTQKAISKRRPALLASSRKFNAYCADFERLRPPGCLIPVPRPLSTALNGLRNENDPTLHEDVWITPSTGSIPRWLDDNDVRDGIRGFHASDRCAEEGLRLNLERENLCRWLAQERAIIAKAIATSTDPSLDLALEQRQDHIEYLEMSWASALRVVVPSTAPTGLGPTIVARVSRTVSIELDNDDEFFGHQDPEDGHPADEDIETLDEMVTTEELDSGTSSDVEEFMVIGDILSTATNDPSDTSNIDPASVQFEIQWQPPIHQRNSNLVVSLTRDPRIVVALDDRPNHTLEALDVDRIRSPTGRLNNWALNGLAASLLSIYGHPTSPFAAMANRCAVLSTFDLHRVHFRASDTSLWRHLSPTKYWEKRLWLLPIHRPDDEHWVFVAVAVHQQQLFFFDSLAQRQGWRKDLRNVMLLVTRMAVLAHRHGYPLHISTQDLGEAWIAQPLFDGRPLQSNGYDCGIWVVCMIGALLRGHADTSLVEMNMGAVRRVLSDHILTLPYSTPRKSN